MSGSPASAGQLGGERRPPVSFEDLLRAHRRELRVHCYRMLGSWTDAEDVLQDVSLRAWRGLDRFEGKGIGALLALSDRHQRVPDRTARSVAADPPRCLDPAGAGGRAPGAPRGGSPLDPTLPDRCGRPGPGADRAVSRTPRGRGEDRAAQTRPAAVAQELREGMGSGRRRRDRGAFQSGRQRLDAALRDVVSRTCGHCALAHRPRPRRWPGLSAFSDLRERPSVLRLLQVRRSLPSRRAGSRGLRAAVHPGGLARATAGHADRELPEPSTGQGVRVRAPAAPRILEKVMARPMRIGGSLYSCVSGEPIEEPIC